jgi:hypothetical protein
MGGASTPRLSLPAECKPTAERVQLSDSMALPEDH